METQLVDEDEGMAGSGMTKQSKNWGRIFKEKRPTTTELPGVYAPP